MPTLMVRPQDQTELYRVGTVEMIWIASMAVAVTPFLACTWGTMKTMLARILPVRRASYTFQRWG
jgi:hypothetical protein